MQVDIGDKDDSFISTEHPMDNTVSRFWRLVFERKSKNIVLMQQQNRNTRVSRLSLKSFIFVLMFKVPHAFMVFNFYNHSKIILA